MLHFAKYSGCGNDFLLIDNRSHAFPIEDRLFIANLCQRRLGVGADGVILFENSQIADCRMRIFNADGGEAEMCGNGIRCLVKFIQRLGINKHRLLIETMHELIPVSHHGDLIAVSMPTDKGIQSIELSIDPHRWTMHCLDTGVPHAVIFTDDASAIDIPAIAPCIRHHPHFSPRGTNVNFATINPNQTIQVRTYERGVEQETLACGTGAVAVALVAAKIYQLSSPIYIQTGSKEILEIRFDQQSSSFSNVMMIGPANFVFEGKLPQSPQRAQRGLCKASS